MEEKKYVADTTLEYYDDSIKSWFVGKIESIPMMDLVYDEENRILEFVESIK